MLTVAIDVDSILGAFAAAFSSSSPSHHLEGASSFLYRLVDRQRSLKTEPHQWPKQVAAGCVMEQPKSFKAGNHLTNDMRPLPHTPMN